MPTDDNVIRYEINLACGDTISSEIRPTVGNYRRCVHCDAQKRVISFWVPEAMEHDAMPDAPSPLPTRQPAVTMDTSAIEAYAHDAAMYRSALVLIQRDIRTLALSERSWLGNGARNRIEYVLNVVSDALAAARVVVSYGDSALVRPDGPYADPERDTL